MPIRILDNKMKVAEIKAEEPLAADNFEEDQQTEDYLKMVDVVCCLCETNDSEQIAAGEDFEYDTSKDKFYVSQCNSCRLVYLNPRPDISEFKRIYPSNYHAFEFSEKEFGFVYKVRRRLEANRLLSWCNDLPEDARILDVGSGDGFHLDVLREFGKNNWQLEGLDVDERAVKIGRKNGLTIHHGTLETANLPKKAYDLIILVQTVEHVAEPTRLLRQIRSILRPGTKIVCKTIFIVIALSQAGEFFARLKQAKRNIFLIKIVCGTQTGYTAANDYHWSFSCDFVHGFWFLHLFICFFGAPQKSVEQCASSKKLMNHIKGRKE